MLFEIKSQMVFMYCDKCPCNNKQKNGREKEAFYNLLEQNINQIARSDIKIVLGDCKLVKKTYTNPPLAMKVYIIKLTTME